MKKILLLSLGLFISEISTAQYTDDIGQNTLISDSSQLQSLCAVLSPEGNLCSFFWEENELKFQVLDANGNKNLDSGGITIDVGVSMNQLDFWYTALTKSQIIFDEHGNILFAYQHLEGVKVKKISMSGEILNSITLTSGKLPKIEKISDTDFIVSYNVNYVDFVSKITRLSDNGTSFSTIWTQTYNYQIERIDKGLDDKIYIVAYGPTEEDGNPVNDGLIVKVNTNLMDETNGELFWSVWVNCSTLDRANFQYIGLSTSLDSENNLYVISTYLEGGGDTQHTYAQKINNSGSILWGENGLLLSGTDGANLSSSQNLYSFYNESIEKLVVFINGEPSAWDELFDEQVYMVKISEDGSGITIESNQLITGTENAYLFAVEQCDENYVLGYSSMNTFNLFVKKISIEGEFLWSSEKIMMSSSEEWKPYEYLFLNANQNEQLILTFLDVRNSTTKGFAQFVSCDGEMMDLSSIDENSLNEVNIFPNPTKGKVIIQKDPSCKIMEIQVTNVMGQTVYSEKDIRNENIEINIEGDSGMYFMTVTLNNNSSKTYKLLKE